MPLRQQLREATLLLVIGAPFFAVIFELAHFLRG